MPFIHPPAPILWCLAAFLCGSIPFGLLLVKLAGKGDVRTHGSGNIGATNVSRVGGKALGVITLLLDILKGFLPVYLAKKAGIDATVSAPSTMYHPPATVSKEDRQQQREADKQRQKEERGRQKRIAELEGAIATEEELLAKVAERLADPAIAGDYQAIQEAAGEHAAIEARLSALYAAWEETAALTEQG